MAVEKLFDCEVHGRPSFRRGFPIIIPFIFNLFGGLSIPFTLRPFGGGHHFLNDGVGIEMGEKVVDEPGTALEAFVGSIYGVYMRGFIKYD
jgi:hypothetical protein